MNADHTFWAVWAINDHIHVEGPFRTRRAAGDATAGRRCHIVWASPECPVNTRAQAAFVAYRHEPDLITWDMVNAFDHQAAAS